MEENLTVTKPVKDIKNSYLAAINNSVGSRLWQNFYIVDGESKVDVMRSGGLSCAFYVSTILSMFGLINKVHATVKSTVKDLKENGYLETKSPTQGDVIVWEAKDFNGEVHAHIGFWWNETTAVSNSDLNGFPIFHHINFYGSRKVQTFYSKEIH
jgi:hypothetical protein